MEQTQQLKAELPPEEIYKEKRPRLLTTATVALLGTFIVGVLGSLSLFFLNGFGYTNLSDIALCALAGATIGETAVLLRILFTRLIPS